MIDNKPAVKKHIRIYEEDNTTITSFKTIDYAKDRAIDDSLNEGIDVNQSTFTSTQGSQKPSAQI